MTNSVYSEVILLMSVKFKHASDNHKNLKYEIYFIIYVNKDICFIFNW